MRKTWILSTVLALALLMPTWAEAQTTIKLRLGGNMTKFLSEPQGLEKNFPEIDANFPDPSLYSDFTHQSGMGFEGEIMLSLSEKVWLGLELGKSKFGGFNDLPRHYNFQYTDFNQLTATDEETGSIYRFQTNLPIEYETSLLNLLGNFRFYPTPSSRFRPFVKLTAGVSFIATELILRDPDEWFNGDFQSGNLTFGPPVLYSRGTANSGNGRWPALAMGAGLGFEFQVTEKIALYADYNYMMVNSDILDGRPNFDYIETTGLLEHFNTMATISKLGFGLCYTIGENFAIFSGGRKGGKSVGKGGRQHPYLPFYEIKRN